MLHAMLWFLTAGSLWVTSPGTDDPVFSGPQPGERVTPFKVLQVSGPQAGKELQLLAEDSGPATMLIFVHETTRPGMQLMRPLDLYGSKLAADGLATQFVWLTPDRSKTEDWLRAARGSLNLKSPINISLDGIEGPGNYGLNRKVSITILLVKDSKVVSNFAIVQPNETDAPKVLAEVAKLAGRTPPAMSELVAELGVGMRRDMSRPAAGTRAAPPAELSQLSDDPAALIRQLEDRIAQMDRSSTDDAAELRQVLRLEAQVARLQARDQEHHSRALARVAELEKLAGELVDALNEARAAIAKLEGKPEPAPIKKLPGSDAVRDEPAQKSPPDLPGRTPNNPELIALMRRMIQPANDEAMVKEISAAMLRWAGDSAQRRDDLSQFAKRIAHLGYGSDAAKPEIKKLAGE